MLFTTKSSPVMLKKTIRTRENHPLDVLERDSFPIKTIRVLRDADYIKIVSVIENILC
jgi:hypothetical protein